VIIFACPEEICSTYDPESVQIRWITCK